MTTSSITESNSSLNKTQNKHFYILDALRGLAALAVCIFHFSNGNKGYLGAADPIKVIGSYGWLGVEVFFVISGFIIPLSLYARSHDYTKLGSFFMRRLKRIEPPYFASIIVVLLLQVLSSRAPGFAGTGFKLDIAQIASHFGYLNSLNGIPWLNPVYWTLALEFQFYIFIALAFPIFCSPASFLRVFSGPICSSLIFFASSEAWITSVMPLFCIGIACFQYTASLLSFSQFIVSIGLILVVSGAKLGYLNTLIGFSAGVLIIFTQNLKPTKTINFLCWLGSISYSLYLLHVPIGGRVINLFSRLPNAYYLRYLGIAIALFVSIFASWLFWRFIEAPSIKWSKAR